MKDFRAHAQRVGEGLRADRHDHEFLEIDRIVGVHAAVDDVHHRHGQQPRIRAADIAVERQAVRLGRGLGDGKRDAEDGVGAEPALVLRAVELDQRLVDLDLVLRLHAADRVEDLAVHGLERLLHALAEVARLVAVAQLDRLVRAGRGAGGNGGAAERAVLQRHIDLDGRIAAAVEDFAADDVDDGGHARLQVRRLLRRSSVAATKAATGLAQRGVWIDAGPGNAGFRPFFAGSAPFRHGTDADLFEG